MRILLLNQCFYPDVVSTAQHATDLATTLAEAGHEVTVVCSRRGYDNPSEAMGPSETWRGIRIVRLPCTGFGKGAKWRRAADFASFLLLCTARLLMLPRFDAVVAMTTPPLISSLGALFVALKGGALVLWMMDLNPDEAIAAGWLRENTPAERTLRAVLGYSLRRAAAVCALDPFMKARLVAKGVPAARVLVVPPWSHDDTVSYDPEGRREFRERHGLADKFVVMYSGNHGRCHPLDTFLQAAEELRNDHRLAFCFVGGGSEFPKVAAFARERGLGNIKCIGYQPLEKLAASLSAADLHLIAMGDPFVGILHPCKIYNVLALGTPFLFAGPVPSHVSELAPPEALGRWAYFVRHADVSGAVRCIRQASEQPAVRFEAAIGVSRRFSQRQLVPAMQSLIENAAYGVPVAAGTVLKQTQPEQI